MKYIALHFNYYTTIMNRLLNITINMKNETVNIQDTLIRLTSTITTLTYIAEEQSKYKNKTDKTIVNQKINANKSIKEQQDWWNNQQTNIKEQIEKNKAIETKKQEKCVYDKLDPDLKNNIQKGSAQAALECNQAVCFHPETLVKMHNDKIIYIKDIKVGNYLKNGKKVKGTMILNNLNDNNNDNINDNINDNNKYTEDLYTLPGGENGKEILVSGSHLIFNTLFNNFVQVNNYKDATISNNNSDTLICLITSDHTIPLGDYIFHDWEDNNGSISKNI